ncbi:MAG: serine hydroxymethyltransferase [Deltaproteobacteria bacterium]|nr:serine hydroxymethyltransferase [Deltaproteobacteria bacterium]
MSARKQTGKKDLNKMEPTAGPILKHTDPFVARLVQMEEERQEEKIILIPSESYCPQPVREALATGFGNLYAEGHPPPRMLNEERDRLEDVERQRALIRRYANRRYYKGCEFADIVEALACKRVCRLFATRTHPPETIHANVQPLSGAAANNAVYEAFMRPGDTLLGLRLSMGGHLTHGSPQNRSGRHYRVVSYEVDPNTSQLDYDGIERMAREYLPRIIVAGFSAFPWAVDWRRLRRIADNIPDCLILADVAHTAGLIVAGVYPNPIDFAHAVSFTTHKTMCGPRGAVILTTDPAMAREVDDAVFPGEQGGPHFHSIAAKAVAFQLASMPEFRALQSRTVENAKSLAASMEQRGLTIAYGGTNSHLLLVDLRKMKTPTGERLSGEIASRILELAGVVVNKNPIWDDEDAAHPSAVRLGTTWASQRGMGPEEMDVIAEVIHDILTHIHPFHYITSDCIVGRGKIDHRVLRRCQERVRSLVKPQPAPSVKTGGEQEGPAWISIRGDEERVRTFLHEAFTADLYGIKPGEVRPSLILDSEGKVLDRVVTGGVEGRNGELNVLLATSPARRDHIVAWLESLSDGYALFNKNDVLAKVHGPVMVKPLPSGMQGPPAMANAWAKDSPQQAAAIEELAREEPGLVAYKKAFFVGKESLNAPARQEMKPFRFRPPEGPLKRTCLYDEHVRVVAPNYIIPFAGWEMPVRYGLIAQEHRAVRECAGLFDVAHMGILEVSGPFAGRFLDLSTTNSIINLIPGRAMYGYILDGDGEVVDDTMIYRAERDRFMMVVNAVNTDRVIAWLTYLNDGGLLPGPDGPAALEGKATIRNLKDPSAGDDQRIDMALQGPRSMDILTRVLRFKADHARLEQLLHNDFIDLELAGAPARVSRTGYTGAEMGFEIYIHPQAAPVLWRQLLDAGKPLGLVPCGLGARDSLRTEAGLPLHGHELAGEHHISPIEAGYAAFVKMHKPFFVGREVMRRHLVKPERGVVRFQVITRSPRMLNPGDPVVDRQGAFVGRVTSAAMAGDRLVGMALVKHAYTRPGTRLSIFPVRGKIPEGVEPLENIVARGRAAIPVEAEVLLRFMTPPEISQAAERVSAG